MRVANGKFSNENLFLWLKNIMFASHNYFAMKFVDREKELARFEKAAGSIMKCFTNYQMEINILQKLSLLLITKLGGARL